VNDRVVTGLGALAALTLFSALLFQGRAPPPVSRPTTVETGANGYSALAQWLRREGVPVRSLRTRADAVTDGTLDVPAAGNLLITTLPHRRRIRHPESSVLWSWISDGNTLVVMAALDDTPEWSLDVDTSSFLRDLEQLTGLWFQVLADEDTPPQIGRPGETTTVTLEPLAAHPLMDGVAALQGVSDSLASIWQPEREEGAGRALLRLARESGSGTAALWQERFGDGQVIVSALGSSLTNRVIGEADNRVFLANLLTYHLAPGAAVIFDDMHQGVTTLYDPEAFFGDPRLEATVLFVLGLWVLYLLGSNDRLAPPVKARRAASQRDFVAGVGGFLARKLSRPEAARLMLASWFDELRRRGVIAAADEAVWPALTALTTVSAQPVGRLRRHHDALERGEDVDLRDLHNTIEELRRMLR
jgi:hypothetical protein